MGAAERRQSEAYPQRNLLPLDCAIVRLFTHMAMYLGANVNLEVIKTVLNNDVISQDENSPFSQLKHF